MTLQLPTIRINVQGFYLALNSTTPEIKSGCNVYQYTVYKDDSEHGTVYISEDSSLTFNDVPDYFRDSTIINSTIVDCSIVYTNIRDSLCKDSDIEDVNIVESTIRHSYVSYSSINSCSIEASTVKYSEISWTNVDCSKIYYVTSKQLDEKAFILHSRLWHIDIGGPIHIPSIELAYSDSYKIITLKHQPATIRGLLWDVTVLDDYLQIGCQRFTIEEWKAFTDEEIEELSSYGLDFWNKHKDFIFNFIEQLKLSKD